MLKTYEDVLKPLKPTKFSITDCDLCKSKNA